MHFSVRKANVLLVGGLLFLDCGCRHVKPPHAGPVLSAPISAPCRPNGRSSKLAAVLCVSDRYPWYMADLTPWRHSIPLQKRQLCGVLGIPRENVRVCENPDPAKLQRLLAGCARDFGDKTVLFYLAAHMKRNGRLFLADNRVLPVRDLVRAINATPCIRVFMLDACHAASAERFGPFRADISRWYAAGPDRAAQAFDKGFRSRRASRFFARVYGVSSMQIDDRSFFVLALGGALMRATMAATVSRPCTAFDVARHLSKLAVEVRHATGITRLPVPVCLGGTAAGTVLFEPIVDPGPAGGRQ